MTIPEFFKASFDELAVNGCIGDPNGIPAYAYLRVSSEGQAEEGRSGLPRQILHCQEIALERGYQIPWDMVYADDDSGFEFRHRKSLTRLRKEYRSRDRRASVIVAERLQRISRNADWQQGFLLDEMKRCGVTPVFWQAFASRVERAVMGAIDQDGMEQQKELMRLGTIHKAKDNRVTAKRPLDGYKFVDRHGNENSKDVRRDTHYGIDQDRAMVIRFVFDAIAYRDLSAYMVANELDAQAKADVRFKPRRAKYWSEVQVTRIVRHPAYKGEWQANRHRAETFYEENPQTGEMKKRRRYFEQPESERTTVDVPLIVDKSTWELANSNLTKNRRRSPVNSKREYLLSGLLRCAGCHWSYHGSFPKRKPRYCCSRNKHLRLTLSSPDACKMSSIACDVMEEAVWSIVARWFMGDPEVLTRAIDEKYNSEGTREIINQIAYLEQQMEAYDKEDTRIRDAYRAGAYTPEEFAAERRSLTAQRDSKRVEVIRLKAQIMTPDELAAKKQEAIRLVEFARQHVNPQDAPFAVKRKLIKALVDEIVLHTADAWFELKGEWGSSVHYLNDISGRAVHQSAGRQHQRLTFRIVYSLKKQAITSADVTFVDSAA